MDKETNKRELLACLDSLGLSYELEEHPVFLTVEDANGYKEWPGIGLKNLFLRQKKTDRYYLVILGEYRRLDMKEFAAYTGWAHNKVRFANEEELMDKLGLEPGAGSLFGILNNKEHDVTVVLDRVLTDAADDEITHFPANVNDATVLLTVGEMKRFLKAFENPVIWEPGGKDRAAEGPENYFGRAKETAVTEKEIEVYDLLEELGITYTLYRHAPAFTTQDFADLGIPLPGIHVKNLFVRDTKDDRHYLVLLAWADRLDVKGYRQSVGWSRRNAFCEEEELQEVLGVTHGSCSVFSMLNDTDRRVTLVVGHTIAAAEDDTTVSFHPNDNRATVILRYGDLKRCIERMGCDVIYAYLPEEKKDE